FLVGPPARVLREGGVVVKNPAQMTRIGAAIVFDKACRLDDPHNLRIELAAVEAIPRDFVESPAAHVMSPIMLSRQLLVQEPVDEGGVGFALGSAHDLPNEKAVELVAAGARFGTLVGLG